MSKTKAAAKKIKLTLVKSPIARLKNHIGSVRGLGLRRLNHSVVVNDSPAIRGMINQVHYLLQVEEV